MQVCKLVAAVALGAVFCEAGAQETTSPEDNNAQIAQLRRQVQEQQSQLKQLEKQLERLASLSTPPVKALPSAVPIVGGSPLNTAVGQAPPEQDRPPEVAPIFAQPGILTPPGKFILEPSLQTSYSSSDRVALVGYTVVPAILIGLVDVRQVKTTTAVAALTGRYGLGSRTEIEAKIPYVASRTDTISREVFTGAAQDRVFATRGNGLGDVELTLRRQLNNGGPDKPFYVGWVRYKSRTGKDPFEVVSDCITRCVANATGTGLALESPTGSGFNTIQPGITVLYPSDPVVIFGSLSYSHSLARDNVQRTVLGAGGQGQTQETIGKVEPGEVVSMNIGVGMALNERLSISLGYDQSIVGKTKYNGQDAPGAARLMLGTLLIGGSYRISPKKSINVSVGAGVTDDSPDASLMVRVPVSW